jgi:tetratricopeptide (TPR) repeat protein
LINDFETAIQYGLKALTMYEQYKIGVVYEQSIFVSLEIGKLFEQQKQNSKAYYYYKKALDIAILTKKEWLIKAPKICIANYLYSQRKFSDSEKIYTEVLLDDKLVNGTEPTMEALSGLGNIFLERKEFNKANASFKTAFDIAFSKGFLTAVDGYAYSIGVCFLKNKQ